MGGGVNMNFKANEVSLQRSLSDVVAEYDAKRSAIPQALKIFEQAGTDIKMAATIGGTYGDTPINVGHVWDSDLETSLLKSAWKHIHDGLNIKMLSSPTDKRLWEQALADPPPFTMDNIRATFGEFIVDPRGNILRGLAEVFCDLDDCYKSHDKVKIGVAGLPKRVILSSVGYSTSYGMDKLRSLMNSLAVFQGKPLIESSELEVLQDLHHSFKPRAGTVTIRNLEIRKFQNGNAHVIFDKGSLRDINLALAEFYGNVLPDTSDEDPTKKPGTAVSKDLQYYPTPEKVVQRIVHDLLYKITGQRVLEPSCGDGRFMDALYKAGAVPFGVEVDHKRAAECRRKGHKVLTANFLETAPTGDFDLVVMNPPFYGKTYAKHVRHAFEYLKPGGKLIAILPVTARYDHGLLDDIGTPTLYGRKWDDLPVGSFSESGTNINTTILTIFKEQRK